jgi:hypothetical protein
MKVVQIIVVLAGMFRLAVADAFAEETLFVDDFELPPKAVLANQEIRQNLNGFLGERQQGSLAPSAYASNGQTWQSQFFRDGMGKVSLRLYSSNSRQRNADDLLLLSPLWKLSDDPGTYSLEITIEPMPPGFVAFPERFVLMLGALDRPDAPGALLMPGDHLAIEIVDFENPKVLLSLAGETVAEQDAIDLGGIHVLAVRWSIGESKRIRNLEVSIDERLLFREANPGWRLEGEAVLFGVGGRSPGAGDAFPSLLVRSLAYFAP